MARPPVGYTEAAAAGARIVALHEALDRVREMVRVTGSLHDYAADSPTSFPLTGRGAAYVLEEGDARWVVRHYRRGGRLANLLVDRYLRGGRPRPWRELAASEKARARGVRTPRIVAAVIHPHGAFYRADLATEYVPDSVDLFEATLGPSRFDAPARVAAWRAAGALLREAWQAGVTHPDLNLRNVLVTADGAWLIDFDRARVARTVGARARQRMLERLHRSRRKLEAHSGETVGADELAAFEEALRG